MLAIRNKNLEVNLPVIGGVLAALLILSFMGYLGLSLFGFMDYHPTIVSAKPLPMGGFVVETVEHPSSFLGNWMTEEKRGEYIVFRSSGWRHLDSRESVTAGPLNLWPGSCASEDEVMRMIARGEVELKPWSEAEHEEAICHFHTMLKAAQVKALEEAENEEGE